MQYNRSTSGSTRGILLPLINIKTPPKEAESAGSQPQHFAVRIATCDDTPCSPLEIPPSLLAPAPEGLSSCTCGMASPTRKDVFTSIQHSTSDRLEAHSGHCQACATLTPTHMKGRQRSGRYSMLQHDTLLFYLPALYVFGWGSTTDQNDRNVFMRVPCRHCRQAHRYHHTSER